MQNIKPFFLIIAILAMLFVGCQNEQIGSESADTTPTSVPSGNSGDKITSLQAVIDEDETGVIDLSQYSDYTFTSYSATINKSITIKGANKDFDKAEITVNKDNVSLSGMKNVKSVTASASLGNGSMRISSSSLSNLNISGGGSHSIYIEDKSDIDIIAVDKILTPESNEFVRLVIDDTVKINKLVIKSGLLIDTTGDVSVDIKNVEFDVSDVPTFIAISPKVTLSKVGKIVDGDVSADQTVRVTFKNDAVSSNALSIYMPKGTKVEDLSADFIISAFEMIVAEPLNQTFKAALTQGFTAMMTEIFDGDTIDETKDIKITVSEGNQIKGEEVNTTPTEETAQYKVKYLFQQVSGDEYESLDGYADQTKSGTIGTMTDVTADSVTGFELQTIDQKNISADGSTEVIVKYNRNIITYTFDAAGGKWNENVDTTTDSGRYGATVTTPANPSRDGYTFSSWDKEVPQTFGSVSETFAAQWNIDHYTVTFKDGVEVLSTQDVTYDCMATEPAAPTKDPTSTVIYSFAYWYVETSPNEAYSFDSPVTGVLTLYAKWNETQLYSITINQGEHGTVTASQTSGIEAGAEITLTITPDNGYVRNALTMTYGNVTNQTITDKTFSMPAANVTIDATFTNVVSYQEASWNGSAVTYTTKTVASGNYTILESSESAVTLENGKWYVVSKDVTITDTLTGAMFDNYDPITVSGTVNIILCDGATLTAKFGINVESGKTLNIYAQSGGTGKLVAGVNIGGYSFAGIGGKGGLDGTACGTVNIHGGNIVASGGETVPGIGGALSGGTVTIYGGVVTATGGQGGAGIGGNPGGTVKIYGGDVTATGVSNYEGGAAGIGGNAGDNDHGTLTVGSGMTVTAGSSSSDAQSMTADAYISSRSAYVKITKQP